MWLTVAHGKFDRTNHLFLTTIDCNSSHGTPFFAVIELYRDRKQLKYDYKRTETCPIVWEKAESAQKHG